MTTPLLLLRRQLLSSRTHQFPHGQQDKPPAPAARQDQESMGEMIVNLKLKTSNGYGQCNRTATHLERPGVRIAKLNVVTARWDVDHWKGRGRTNPVSIHPNG
eukprot:60983-Prorocentrum_minimum.AAC.6